MTISVGDRIPDVTLRTPGADGPEEIRTAEFFAGQRIVLFAVPGAFTPTCSMNHLPGFLALESEIRAKGVDAIAVLATNDVHVMKAWRNATEAGERILFLSDGNAEWTAAAGLDQDLAVAGMGVRSRRYSMLVEDGVVRRLNIETGRGQVDESSAETLLAQL